MHLLIPIFLGVFAALWLFSWTERRRAEKPCRDEQKVIRRAEKARLLAVETARHEEMLRQCEAQEAQQREAAEMAKREAEATRLRASYPKTQWARRRDAAMQRAANEAPTLRQVPHCKWVPKKWAAVAGFHKARTA